MKAKPRPSCAVHGSHDATTKEEIDGRWYHVCDQVKQTVPQPPVFGLPSVRPERIVRDEVTEDQAMAIARGFARPFSIAELARFLHTSESSARRMVRDLVKSGRLRRCGSHWHARFEVTP